MNIISVVIPVYQGETTLRATIAEIMALADGQSTPAGRDFSIGEVILVHDNGPDRSDVVIRSLQVEDDRIVPVWLSKNFGQHAALYAGIARSTGQWIVTMDEDGQQDPTGIAAMLDAALDASAQVVYARPLNPPPHGALRNLASRGSKTVVAALSGSDRTVDFNSFRLISGPVARAAAALAGPGAYFDITLGWVAGRYTTVGTVLRSESRASGYSARSLASHFWRLVVSSGTRALRVVSMAGVLFAVVGALVAVWVVVVKVFWGIDTEGWTSLVIIMLFGFGAVLLTLGVVAEFIGTAVNTALGKPLYVILAEETTPPGR